MAGIVDNKLLLQLVACLVVLIMVAFWGLYNERDEVMALPALLQAQANNENCAPTSDLRGGVVDDDAPHLVHTKDMREAAALVDCWATQGEFRNSTTLFLKGYFVTGPNVVHECYEKQLSDRIDEARFYWEPDSDKCGAPFEHFNGVELCRIMDGRHILMVGDSLQAQMFESFHAMMWRDLAQYGGDASLHILNLYKDRRLFECDGMHGSASGFRVFCFETYCEGTPYKPFTLEFVRNDRNWLNTKVENNLPMFLEMPWLDRLKDFAVVVLNRGAHYTELSAFSSEMDKTLEALATKLNFTGLTIYRATPPGHKDCGSYHHKAPIKERQNPSTLPYNWGDFAPQNAWIKQDIASSFADKIIYMDVDHVTALRPDSHAWSADCIHYCRPGPIDFWNDMLYNTIRASLHHFPNATRIDGLPPTPISDKRAVKTRRK